MKTSELNVEYQGRKKSGSEAVALQKQDGRSSVAPLQSDHEKPNAALVWKQFEDLLTARVLVSPIEHATYSYLLRHSFLEGERSSRFSIRELARHVHASDKAARKAVRRLAGLGVFRLVERSKAGHLVEVRLPEEVPGMEAKEDGQAMQGASLLNVEEIDFLRSKELREAIHAREGGVCFYCLRQIDATMKCLDHVMPRAAWGGNSYRNLVSCCLECNSQKGEKTAALFLRKLHREGRLTLVNLNRRLRALKELKAGKMKPEVKMKEVKEAKELEEGKEGDGIEKDAGLKPGATFESNLFTARAEEGGTEGTAKGESGRRARCGGEGGLPA